MKRRTGTSSPPANLCWPIAVTDWLTPQEIADADAGYDDTASSQYQAIRARGAAARAWELDTFGRRLDWDESQALYRTNGGAAIFRSTTPTTRKDI